MPSYELIHDTTLDKLIAMSNGSEVELETTEARIAGAFTENALNETDARESMTLPARIGGQYGK